MAANEFDILVVGAGISGINAGYHIQTSLPGMSYAILESRTEMGGTWSLFNYPGIRSDSDLYTFGFSWDPWNEDRTIADGPSILAYLKKVAVKHGIDRRIQYNTQVTRLEWNSISQHWTVTVLQNGIRQSWTARFVFMGTGLYDYGQGEKAEIPGIENFQGQVVHPQFWPQDLDYENKSMVVIGSGATAITLIPSLSGKAARVTMLQRSPGYYVTVPENNPVDTFIKTCMPAPWAGQLLRWKYILGFFLFFQLMLRFPSFSKKFLRRSTEPQLPKHLPYDPHFTPTYDPWQQRMCVTPQGDFFKALRDGKADVVTDNICRVDKNGILLASGRRLDADIIVTATGLRMLMFGHAEIIVDGQAVHWGDKFTWRGSWIQDVPNLAFSFGYTNAPWTLGAETSTILFVRIIKEMLRRGYTAATPTVAPGEDIQQLPFLNLKSNYVLKAQADKRLPQTGDKGPWKGKSSFLQEYWRYRWGHINEGLEFTKPKE